MQCGGARDLGGNENLFPSRFRGRELICNDVLVVVVERCVDASYCLREDLLGCSEPWCKTNGGIAATARTERDTRDVHTRGNGLRPASCSRYRDERDEHDDGLERRGP